MLTPTLVVACKETIDALRDVRSLVSSLFYALMGPLVVGLVSAAGPPHSPNGAKVVVSMLSIFTLVAAFVGGMSIAMDTVAGERERHSLLPLLLNPVPRIDLLAGKWLAVSLFAIAGLLLNLAGSALVLVLAGIRVEASRPQVLLVMALVILPLPLLAASAQIAISTLCRALKEAQTYLSLLVFLPMALGMLVVFSPAPRPWCGFLPLVGQELQLQSLVSGTPVSAAQALLAAILTAAAAALILRFAAARLHRDEIVYGN